VIPFSIAEYDDLDDFSAAGTSRLMGSSKRAPVRIESKRSRE